MSESVQKRERERERESELGVIWINNRMGFKFSYKSFAKKKVTITNQFMNIVHTNNSFNYDDDL